MSKKKLFDYSIEEYKTAKRPEGWDDILGYVLKKGPINPNKLGNKIALEALVEEGLVAEAVVNDEDESAVVATPEGKQVYNEVLYQDKEDRPLSEILEKADSTDAINEELVVANEGFVDWVKDLFTEKVNQKKLERLGNKIDSITDFSKKNLRKRLVLDHWWFSNEDAISFFFKNNRVVTDISKEITNDIDSLKLVESSLNNINTTLSKLNYTEDEGVARDTIESSFDRKLIDKLDGISLLYGIVLSVNGKNKIRRLSSLPDDFYDENTVVTSVVYGPDGKPIGHTRTTVPVSKGKLDEYKLQAQGALTSNEDIQAAFKKMATFGSNAEKSINDFFKNTERLKGTQTKAIRGFMRNGQNIALTLYYILTMYGEVAEKFILVNKKNED